MIKDMKILDFLAGGAEANSSNARISHGEGHEAPSTSFRSLSNYTSSGAESGAQPIQQHSSGSNLQVTVPEHRRRLLTEHSNGHVHHDGSIVEDNQPSCSSAGIIMRSNTHQSPRDHHQHRRREMNPSKLGVAYNHA